MQKTPLPARNGSLTPEAALKLKALRMLIRAGIDQLERGEFTEIADTDLDRYLEELTVASGKPARARMRSP
jgi:hypothetical protein